MRAPVKALCRKWQRVSGPRGKVLRCKAYRNPRGPTGISPANKGRGCERRQHVWSPFFNKQVLRCRSYGSRAATPTAVVWGGPKFKRAEPARRLTPLRVPGRRVALPPPAPVRRPAMQLDLEIPAYIPLSLPSMERVHPGRTVPARVAARFSRS